MTVVTKSFVSIVHVVSIIIVIHVHICVNLSNVFKVYAQPDRLVVIMGDFNLPCVDWSNYHCPNDSVYQVFLNFFNCYGFHQNLTKSTCADNIRYLILSTSSKFVSELPPVH